MKKLSKNIRIIMAASLLALAIIGTIISVSKTSSTPVELSTDQDDSLDLNKTISVLP